MKPSVFLVVVIFSVTLVACGGGGNGGGGDDRNDDDDGGGDPGVNPGLNSGGGNPKSFGMMEGEIMDSTQMQDDMDIDMSGEMIGAPLFSLLSTRQNRWPHVKLRINGRNVIGFVDTGAGGYAFMDDDSARALGLGAEHLIRTRPHRRIGRMVSGRARRFHRLFALSSRFGNRRLDD